ncbi:acyl-CoA dehydrogenase family protein [Actinoplanes sp. G11-F43]|uniref:acyl-CoA dehydrogenase family protein n=1 Tax=Actinoplanes sp. G11-F43 TaxID=3424130 RepID=UPI003D32F92D
MIYRGHVPWNLLTPFPDPEPDPAGDAAVALAREVLGRHVDPVAGGLPDDLLPALLDAGLLTLMITPELGGGGLSWAAACRVVEEAARWSMAAAYAIAINNGFGSGVYLTALPPGPLRELIAGRVAAGLFSGGADAEPTGTANQTRTTIAVRVDDAYELTGTKVFIGNAPVAGLMDVSATLDGEVRLFFADTAAPGFEVVHTHEFMGLHGARIGMIRLDRVRVPAGALMPELSDGWRMRPDGTAEPGVPDPATDLGLLALLGRHLVISGPSLATARAALGWQREFAARRHIDGRPLATYPEVARQVTETEADGHLIESVHLWCVHDGRTDRRPDLEAAKNVMSRAAWRAVDDTLSMLGGEGYETAASKSARGAVPSPVERAFRDARGLRVAGGVDTMLDKWSAEAALRDWSPAAPWPAAPPGGSGSADMRRVDADAARLAGYCARRPGGQRTRILLGRIAGELFGQAVTLARDPGHRLARTVCARSRYRLAALFAELDDTDFDTDFGTDFDTEEIA